MRSLPNRSILVMTFLLITVATMLAACGGGEIPLEDVVPEPTKEEMGSESQETEMNTTGTEFEEAELPEDFPAVFPLPENTKVASTVPMPGDNSYRVFFSFPESSLEEILPFYAHELQANDWTVYAEGPEEMGYGMVINHPDHDARLDFIEEEYGVVLDLTIVPAGELEEVPVLDENFGDSDNLGDSGGSFPEDFPLPVRFTPIDLPSKLAGEGYQLAYSFPDMAELAMVEISTTLMTAGWEIGEFEANPLGGYYMVPFTGPDGFEGYALISNSPDVVGLATISGAVIALHEGTP